MADLPALINAPWTTILTLATGYAAYFVAHVGLREHHQPVDQAFRVILYGFFGMVAYVTTTTQFGRGTIAGSLAALLAAVALGALWRKWGRRSLTGALRGGRISMSDDLPTAWAALADAGEQALASQLAVRLADGTILFCDDLARFRTAPNGPCILGGSGDVLMYVTHIGKPDSADKLAWKEASDLQGALDGLMISYIPRDQIRRVQLRRLPR